jgi:hypothetical protein
MSVHALRNARSDYEDKIYAVYYSVIPVWKIHVMRFVRKTQKSGSFPTSSAEITRAPCVIIRGVVSRSQNTDPKTLPVVTTT